MASKLRILTPAFEAPDPKQHSDTHAIDITRLKNETFRLGLLDNTKPNAGILMQKVAEELARVGLVSDIISVVKTNKKANPAGSQASPELLEQLAQKSDFVITGLGN